MLKPTSGSLIEQYTKKIEETEKLLAKIRQVSSALTYQGMERINKVALLEVRAKHTNEFTIYLGADYYAEVRAEGAIRLYQQRIKGYRDMLATIEKKSLQINSKQKKETTSKEQKVAFSQNMANKNGSFLEVIGEENGESIYNIMEVEGEEEARPAQKQVGSTSILTESKPIQDKLLNMPKDQLLPPLEQNSTSKMQQQQLIDDQLSQDEDDDGQQQVQVDLIRSHWNKRNEVPAKTELAPIVQKSQAQTVQIQHPALPAKSSHQHKAKQKQAPSKTSKSKPLPEKISKFKLQKMREKLLKE